MVVHHYVVFRECTHVTASHQHADTTLHSTFVETSLQNPLNNVMMAISSMEMAVITTVSFKADTCVLISHQYVRKILLLGWYSIVKLTTISIIFTSRYKLIKSISLVPILKWKTLSNLILLIPLINPQLTVLKGSTLNLIFLTVSYSIHLESLINPSNWNSHTLRQLMAKLCNFKSISTHQLPKLTESKI